MTDPPRQHHLGTRFLVNLACVVVVVAGMKAAQSILIPFMVSVFLAILGLPPLVWLQRKRVPTSLAVIIVILVMVGFLALVGTLVGNSIDSFVSAVPRYQAKLSAYAENLDPSIQRFFGREEVVLMADDVTTAVLSSKTQGPATGASTSFNVFDYLNAGAVMQLVGGTLKGLAGVLSNTLLVILTMVFILLEAAGFAPKIRAALGRPEADLSRFSRVTWEVQRYLAIKTLTSLVTGVLVGVWCAVLQVDFPLLWGLVAFLLNFVPTLGSIIAAIPPVLLALVQAGRIGPALMVAVGYVIVNIVIGNIIEPNMMGRQLGLSTLVVFLSLVFWGWVWGPVGMLLSVPLTMILKILLENTEEFRWVAILLGSSGAAARELRSQASAPPTNPD